MKPESPKPFEGKTCFVITPIGGDGTAIRREADGIVDEVLIPVLEGYLGFKVSVAHRIESTGSISQQVIRDVMEADLAICNLTTLNPNVMYELALRHAVRLPVVTIASDSTKLPFDIAEDRVIFYQNDIMGANILKDKLRPMVEACMKDDEPDNPVYRAITASKVIKEVHTTGGSEAAIFDALERLNRRMDKFQLGPGDAASIGFLNTFTEIEIILEDVSVDTRYNEENAILSTLAVLFNDAFNTGAVTRTNTDRQYKVELIFPNSRMGDVTLSLDNLRAGLVTHGYKLILARGT
jgi:hypothetical protein